MLFSSITFIFLFLPIVLAVYYLVPHKAKNVVLLIISLFFYAWGEPLYVILLILSILFNYMCGLDIKAHADEPGKAKRGAAFAVAGNLLIMCFFKYFGFLMETVNAIFPFDIPYRELALPVGISFYTLRALSYILDVYWKRADVQKNIVSFALYISLFPQIIAGPVSRYADIADQLKSRRVNMAKTGQGFMLFTIGLAKKTVIANGAGEVFEKISGFSAGDLSVLTAWLGVFSFAFQIYFDFSGYSDMACGLGRMFGFEFRKNFDYPYTSKSVTEFFRRWHISLGAWFREYVYIPLGGNQCAVSRNILNLMIVWLLTGIWHGGAWNFVAWGVYFGVFLVMEKYIWGALLDELPNVVRHIYTVIVVLIGWVLFFSPSLGYAFRYFLAMLGAGAGFADHEGVFILLTHWLLYLLAAIGSTTLGIRIIRGITGALRSGVGQTIVSALVFTGMFLTAVVFLVTDGYVPFIYFRF